MKKTKLICYDIETTGTDPNRDEILQLAIVNSCGEKLYNGYFKPEKATEWLGAQAVNGISPEMVANSPLLSSELPIIQEIFDNAEIIIGYNNLNFDDRFLNEKGIVFTGKDETDVMLEFAQLHGHYNPKYGNYKWEKLTIAAEFYDYDWQDGNEHNALDDATATLYVYQHLKLENKM